jgi:hypothetical protein
MIRGQRAAHPSRLECRRKSRAQQQCILFRSGLNILMPRFDQEPFARAEGFDLTPLCGKP